MTEEIRQKARLGIETAMGLQQLPSKKSPQKEPQKLDVEMAEEFLQEYLGGKGMKFLHISFVDANGTKHFSFEVVFEDNERRTYNVSRDKVYLST